MTSTQNPKQGQAQKDKPIDYILVVKEKNLPLIKQYSENLQVLGFQIENEKGKTVDLIFIKLFISEEALIHFSQVYDIGNEEVRDLTVLFMEPIFANPFSTPISRIIPKVKGEITEAEKIMIVNQVLENTKFGENEKDFGLSKLIKLQIVETAYPLHDGSISKELENIRSQLFYHWSTTRVMHRQQPLDLIYRYFGTEVAFYFTWMEYFNTMLIIPAILGALTFLGSAAFVLFIGSEQIEEVCQNNDSYICPTCEDDETCYFKPISNYCALAHYSILFDNEVTVAFAVFMSFWAILFLNLWRRKENKLKMRWYSNVEEHETNIRQAYIDGATHKRRNVISGELEPYTPKYILVIKYCLTSAMWALMILIFFAVSAFNDYIKVISRAWFTGSENEYLISNAKLLSICEGSILQVICIILLQQLNFPYSMKLTQFENPPTEHAFDNSILYKKYTLSFTNFYMPLFYLAFFKGVLYTLPHNATYFKDVCQPLNCIVELCIQLVSIMTLKDLAANVSTILILKITSTIKKIGNYCISRFTRMEERRIMDELPQWEEEYFLHPTGRYFFTSEFTEMIIKYGLVTFFVAAFPLAPLCALVNNIIKLRSDAFKLVKLYRRPVPLSRAGIGAWNGVLLSITYMSTATNAFVIAFTSDWVPRQVFRFNSSAVLSIPGYFNSTMSLYDSNDYDKYKGLKNFVPRCFYRGYHYPENHPQRYQYTQEYWVNLTFRFVAIFVFEHFLLLCNAVLSYCIPNFPHSVQEQLDMDEHIHRTARYAEFEKHVEKSGKINKDKIKTTIKLHRD